MNKKQIVWVVGTSAAGKETFLKTISTDDALQGQLAWSGKTIAISQLSIVHIVQVYDDPVIQLRLGILDEVSNLLVDNDVVLIKWQIVDSDAGLPSRLLELFPDSEHVFCEIEAPKEILVKRLIHKTWWDSNDDAGQHVDNERATLVSIIAGLGDGFAHIRVKNNDNDTSRFSVIKTGFSLNP